MTIDYIVYHDGFVKGPTGRTFQFGGVDEARAFVRRATGVELAEGDGILKTLALNALGVFIFIVVCALAAWAAEKGLENECEWHARLEAHAKICDGNCVGEFAEWCPSTRLRLGLVK